MEEIKRMIEEAKHPHFNDAGHPHEGTYMFSEELFSLLEKLHKRGYELGAFDAFTAEALGANLNIDKACNMFWQQLRKAIDN